MQMREPITRPLNQLDGNSTEWLEELRRSHQPLVLTVDGQATAVLQDAESYQKMVDRLEELEEVQAIQAGLEDAAAGRTLPLDEALEKLRAEFGLHR